MSFDDPVLVYSVGCPRRSGPVRSWGARMSALGNIAKLIVSICSATVTVSVLVASRPRQHLVLSILLFLAIQVGM